MDMNDEFIRLQKLLADRFAPLNVLGETINKQRLEEFRLFQERFDYSISEPMREFQRVMSEESARMKELYNDDIIESARQSERNLREMQEAMNSNIRNLIGEGYLEPQRQMQNTFGNLIGPTLEIQKTLSELFGPSHQMRQTLEDFSVQMNRVSDSIDMGFLNESIKLKETLGNNLTTLLTSPFRSRDLFNEFEELNKTIDAGDFIILEDGSISLGIETISANEISVSLAEFFESIDFPDAENFLERLRGLKKPLKTFILFVIRELFVAILAIYIDHEYITPKYQKREIIKEFRRETANEMNPKSLSNYKIIVADVLNVRAKPNHKSLIVGKLYFGKIVRVIRKQKDWTLIEITSEDTEVVIRGWVYSRYLTKSGI